MNDFFRKHYMEYMDTAEKLAVDEVEPETQTVSNRRAYDPKNRARRRRKGTAKVIVSRAAKYAAKYDSELTHNGYLRTHQADLGAFHWENHFEESTANHRRIVAMDQAMKESSFETE